MIQKQTYDVDEILGKSMPEIEVTEFNRNNQSITIYRTKRSQISDPYIFYIQAMIKNNPNLDIKKFINNDSIAKPITKQELFKQVEDLLLKLKEQYTFKLHGDLIQAVEFEEKELGTQLLCETTEEVIFLNCKLIA
jgi:hypothetical protein